MILFLDQELAQEPADWSLITDPKGRKQGLNGVPNHICLNGKPLQTKTISQVPHAKKEKKVFWST